MATINNENFGEITTMDHGEYYGYLVRLNFDLGLGNNFSYQHYINAIFEGMKANCNRDLFIEWCTGLDLDSDLIIISNNGKELNTCLSDFMDHVRDLWFRHCEATY